MVKVLAGLAVVQLAVALALVWFPGSNLPRVPPAASAAGPGTGGPSRPAALYTPSPIGRPFTAPPIIAHVAIHDLDHDGLPDLLVCDATANEVTWLRQFPRGTFTEARLGDPVPGPAHVAVADLDGDGRDDLLVASMGMVLPNNDRIGSVVILHQQPDGTFRNRIIADHIARVTDVRAADFNGDGRLDLAVGQFGYVEGQIQWLENRGGWTFVSHPLLNEPGTIMVPVADYDGDRQPDIAALVSQDAEAVHLFTNLGHGTFRDDVIWRGPDESWASSGLDVADLDRDGRPDLIYTNGDGFNVGFSEPSPWHGLQWFENRGNGAFAYHRIGDMPGCYSPVGTDLDGDGDIDIVAVSAFNHVKDTGAVWLAAWLNDGHQHFTFTPLATGAPTHLITVAAGDLDGDGWPELVTGAFHAYPPYGDMSRLTLWRRHAPAP